jgi:hypothetical protein
VSEPSPSPPTPEKTGETAKTHLAELRAHFGPEFAINKPKPDVHPTLSRGWLIPAVTQFDDWTWQRWSYWYQIAAQQESPDGRHLPDQPIPQIEFEREGYQSPGHKRTRKMWEASLEAVSPSWGGWGSDTYWHYVLDWLLFGLGGEHELPKEPYGCEGASDRLYQVFNACAAVLYPYDYIGDIFAESKIGRGAAFFPTPHTLVELITRMTFGEVDSNGRDRRLLTTLDPCIGTGRFGLFASNYSLCISGMDINPIMVKACKVNAFLYAPWMARPIAWVWEMAESCRAQDAAAKGEPAPSPLPVGIRMERAVKRGQAVLL